MRTFSPDHIEMIRRRELTSSAWLVRGLYRYAEVNERPLSTLKPDANRPKYIVYAGSDSTLDDEIGPEVAIARHPSIRGASPKVQRAAGLRERLARPDSLKPSAARRSQLASRIPSEICEEEALEGASLLFVFALLNGRFGCICRSYPCTHHHHHTRAQSFVDMCM